MKPLFLVSTVALALLCSACATHGIKKVSAIHTPPQSPPPAGSGAVDNDKKSSDLFQITEQGTAADYHSDLQSKTPDGGKSASAGASAAPTTAIPVVEGVDVPTAADIAAGDLAAQIKALSAGKDDATLQDLTTDKAKASGPEEPMDGSDPSVDHRPAGPHRKTT
jgi:hypothetical protein